MFLGEDKEKREFLDIDVKLVCAGMRTKFGDDDNDTQTMTMVSTIRRRGWNCRKQEHG